ncbi:MAG: hypothetical protein PHH60_05450, partial [Candidatus Margulisbacteria bacterium]|nr:hypothetical protein [Candidatus Margulisiibacteriota bacterium]
MAKGARAPFILLLCFLAAPVWAVNFHKQINTIDLMIESPGAYDEAGKKYFVDKNNQLGVAVEFGELKVKATQVSYDP